MNIVKNYINKFKIFNRNFSLLNGKKDKKIPLGRWSLDYDNNDLKIAYANHDSCGGELCSKPICAEVIHNSKNNSNKKTDNKNNISDNDLYIYSMIGSFHIDPKKKI